MGFGTEVLFMIILGLLVPSVGPETAAHIVAPRGADES
jgi:hypothetical protein